MLSESFGVMFPNIVEENRGEKRYVATNGQGKDVMSMAKTVKNINDIPKAEMMRLMEGWIRLRRKLQEGEVSKGVSSILLNFRVPNPRQSLDRYMLYKVGDEQRLIIRWGYETKESPAVSLERAISILMDVPLGHMQSILSTSMSPTTSTVPVGQMLAHAAVDEGGGKRSGDNKLMYTLIGLSVVILAIGGYGILRSLSLEAETPQQVSEPPILFSEPMLLVSEEVEQMDEEPRDGLEIIKEEGEEIVELAPVEQPLDRVQADEEIAPVVEVQRIPNPSLEDALIDVDSEKPIDISAMLSASGGEGGAAQQDKFLTLDGMLQMQKVEKEEMLGEMFE